MWPISSTERGSSPAVLFDSIKNYPKGYRVLVNSLGSTKRLGLSSGMPQDLSAHGIRLGMAQEIQGS